MTQTSRLVIEISTEAAKRNAEIIRQELQRMNAAGNNTINITNNISTNMNQAARSMDATRSAARSLISTLGGMAVAYKAIHAADEWTGLKNRLILVTNSQQELNTAMSATFNIAQKTGSSWENAAQVYQRFAQNAKELGINQQRIAAITETVAKATALSGGSAESASAALTQFGQALASGVLRGEEFNSVMEQAPGLAQALAKGLGVPVGKLRALAQEGKITAKAMIEALEKVAPTVEADFNKTAFTISQNLTKIQNAVVKFVGESNGGAAGVLADSLGRVAENLQLISNIAGAAAIGYVTKAMVAGTAAGYARISQLSAQIKLEQTEIAQALRQAQAEQNAATAEMSRARAAVTAAEMRVTADRQVIASNIQTLQSTQAQYRAELQLEQTRLAAQINQQGRTASVTRMAQLRQAEAVVVRELQLAEAQLAATTTASSAQYTAARTAQTAATDRLAVATGRLNAAQAASAASAGLAARAGTSLMAIMGGPAGLIGLAVAAGAAFYLMRDSSDAAKDSIADQSLSIEELRKKYAGLNAETLKLKAIDAGDRIKEENDKIADSFASLDSRVYKILAGGGTQPQAAALQGYLEDLRAGGDRAAKALAVLESKKVFTQNQIKSVAELGANVKASRDEISRQNQILDIATNKNQQAANAVDAHAASQNNLKNKTNEATEALKKYLNQQQTSAWKTQFAATYSAKNKLPTDFGNMVAEATQANDNKPLTQQQTNDLWRYYQAQQAVTELEKRRNDVIKAGEKAVTDREKVEKKANDEYLKQLEKQADMRKQISSQYANTLEQNRFNFADAKTDILGAGFSEKDQAKYIGLAQRFYQRIDDEYFKHLNLELKEYTWTEQQKLDYAYKMDKQILTNSIENLDEINDAKREALDRAYAYQTAQIKLRNEQQVLSAQQGYMTEAGYMQERYRLEREEIQKNLELSEEFRKKLLEINQANIFAIRNQAGAAVGSIQQRFNEALMQRNNPRGYAQYQLQNQYETDSGALSGAYRNNQDAIANDPLLDQQQKEQQLLDAHQQYLSAKAAMDAEYNQQQQDLLNQQQAANLAAYSNIFGDLSGLARAFGGEQSSTYRALFAAQKAFALSSSLVNNWKTISDAYANEPGTIWNKIAAGVVAASETGVFSAAIQAITPQGFSAGGYTGPGGKYDVAGLVHKGEVVWSQEDIKRAGGVGTVEAMRTGTRVDNAIAAQGRGLGSSTPKVTVNNYGNDRVDIRDDGSGGLTIDIVRKEIAARAPAAVANDLASSPNSTTSKAMSRHYQVQRNR